MGAMCTITSPAAVANRAGAPDARPQCRQRGAAIPALAPAACLPCCIAWPCLLPQASHLAGCHTIRLLPALLAGRLQRCQRCGGEMMSWQPAERVSPPRHQCAIPAPPHSRAARCAHHMPMGGCWRAISPLRRALAGCRCGGGPGAAPTAPPAPPERPGADSSCKSIAERQKLLQSCALPTELSSPRQSAPST